MRFNVTAGTLATEVGLLLTVAGKKTTMNICSSVLVRAEKDEIVLTATDLDCTLRARIPAEVQEPGSIALDAKRLHGLASSFEAADRVSFASQKDNWMGIDCGRTKVRVPGISSDDFPGIPAVDLAGALSVPAEALLEVLRRALPGANADDPNYAGMCLRVKDGSVAVASTNGHRAISAAKKVEASGAVEIVASRSHMEVLAKLIDGASGSIDLAKSEGRAYTSVGPRLLIMKLEANPFPPLETVVEKSRSKTVEPVYVDRQRLMRMVRRAAFLAGAAKDDVPVVLMRLAAGQLEVRAEGAADGAELEDVLEVAYTGKPVQFGYGAGYLRDFLSMATGARVRLSMGDGTILEDDGADHMSVIMTRAVPDRHKQTKAQGAA